MKRVLRPALLLAIFLGLAFLSTALTESYQPAFQELPTATAAVLQTPTATQAADLSEIGSTDGIVAMGGIIVLIVIVPILLRWKHWFPSASG